MPYFRPFINQSLTHISPPFGGRNFWRNEGDGASRFTAFFADMALLLVSFGEPLVTFETALLEGRSDYRKEVSVLGAVVVHHSRHLATSVGGVEGIVLLLSGLGGQYSVLSHSCHNLGGIVTTAVVGGGRV